MSERNERLITVVIQDGELEEVMRELQEAQDTIFRCYSRLEKLGVLRIEKKDTASGN